MLTVLVVTLANSTTRKTFCIDLESMTKIKSHQNLVPFLVTIEEAHRNFSPLLTRLIYHS